MDFIDNIQKAIELNKINLSESVLVILAELAWAHTNLISDKKSEARDQFKEILNQNYPKHESRAEKLGFGILYGLIGKSFLDKNHDLEVMNFLKESKSIFKSINAVPQVKIINAVMEHIIKKKRKQNGSNGFENNKETEKPHENTDFQEKNQENQNKESESSDKFFNQCKLQFDEFFDTINNTKSTSQCNKTFELIIPVEHLIRENIYNKKIKTEHWEAIIDYSFIKIMGSLISKRSSKKRNSPMHQSVNMAFLLLA